MLGNTKRARDGSQNVSFQEKMAPARHDQATTAKWEQVLDALRAKETSRTMTELFEIVGLDDTDDNDDLWDEQHNERAVGLDDPNASSCNSSICSEATVAKRGAPEVVIVSKKKSIRAVMALWTVLRNS
ncbi:hypothetical protein V1524DRAFT_455516 [Lipomyces starkeyi]